MFRGEHTISATEEGVDAGGEDIKRFFRIRDLEGDLDAFAPADPILLHLQGGFGPIQGGEILLQFVGIAGDAEDPLAHGHADDGVATALGLAVNHLFVGQDSAEFGAIIDRDVIDVSKVMLIHLEEDPLRPFVIAGIGGFDLFAPVIGKTQRLDLLFEVGDVLVGEDGRMLVIGNRELLRGEAEGVPAHRVKDVIALHPLHPRDDVARGVAFGVADVKTLPRRIREHVEGVVFGFGEVMGVAMEGIVLFPVFAPLGFEILKIVHSDKILP